MKKAVIIGIIVAIIVILSISSIGILSQIDDYKKSMNESSTENNGNKIGEESKPIGKDLSIELEEKMGLSSP
jgi:hypothetical protein